MSLVDPARLAAELVAIPSESGKEDAVADRLESLFRCLGWSPVRRGRNLYAVLGGSGPLVLLNSHADTVPVGEGWTRSPTGTMEGGRLYGRGANDAKGCLAAMIAGAAAAYSEDPPPGRVCLAATCEEETSGQGLEALLPELPRPDAAVVGEPTGLQPAVAQKGLVLLTITAKGMAAHSAWGGGANAIHAAARDILALASLALDREHPLLGRTTLQVTRVAGGRGHNIIPDRCEITVDARITPDYLPGEVVDAVRKAVSGEVTVRSERLVPVQTDPRHPIVQAALAANPGASPFGSPTLSDWVFLKGIPAVKAGPGDSRRSHTPDEYVELEELRAGAAFYERLIRHYLASAAASAAASKAAGA